jgi:hypothetical protein
MSVRVFAEYLGVRTSAVSGWEHRSNPAPPSLATQRCSIRALKLADADAKTRFGLILASVPDCACGADTGNRRSVAGGSTVTPLHWRERARAAS